jgi:hypothetical protein
MFLFARFLFGNFEAEQRVFGSRKTKEPVYSLTLRQSCMKQQSMFPHSPFDHPKQGVLPSVCWIAWISSAFFVFPGVMPRPLAFSLILDIFMDFVNTFTVDILFYLSILSILALCKLVLSDFCIA